jgi:hypothetical protein
MKTAVEWVLDWMSKNQYFIGNDLLKAVEQAKAMEKEQSYTYDELRTIAYNAYCLSQLDEPTEGKYNLWIQQFKKEKI